MTPSTEINFDGLVGPTHHYAGLSHGNLASMEHRGAVAHPRAAALQGLAKMKLLLDLGIPQAVLPPHERPDLRALRRFGFTGSDAHVLERAAQAAPQLLSACSSASAMWTANAATVTPSSDAQDCKVHFTVANLTSQFHRSLEPEQTERTLLAIFRSPEYFTVHGAIPAGQSLGDEGAANHTRFGTRTDGPGLHLLVYGHEGFGRPVAWPSPRRFSSRQAREASAAVARLHRLTTASVLFARQNPAAIDAGAFHNDVVSVGHENLFLYHEEAFAEGAEILADLKRQFRKLRPGTELMAIAVPSDRISLVDAVRSYLFNAQIVTRPFGEMAFIAPTQCRELPHVSAYLDELIARRATPLRERHDVDLRESMQNGGGPACLRLRVILTEAEAQQLPPAVLLTPATLARLEAWVRKHYRESLAPPDLADPQLLHESRCALDELTGLLGLGSIYPCQLEPAA